MITDITPPQRNSIRSALIAGITALGISAALPQGVIPDRTASAVPVSNQDVALVVYIPGWSDAMLALNNFFYDLEPAVTAAVYGLTNIGLQIPVVNIVAAQVDIIYNSLGAVLWSALTCGIGFLGTLDPSFLASFVSNTIIGVSNFVQWEVNFFASGGWLPFPAAATPVTAQVPSAGAAADEGPSDAGRPAVAAATAVEASQPDAAAGKEGAEREPSGRGLRKQAVEPAAAVLARPAATAGGDEQRDDPGQVSAGDSANPPADRGEESPGKAQAGKAGASRSR